MRKIIVSEHVTLDGFVAGPNGEMDWISISDEMFDLVGTLTNEADTALYGRVTYEMMNSYWPTAADQPNASKHDIEHSKWYNNVEKVVLSKTMEDTRTNKTTFIGSNIPAAIKKLKQERGKNILIFGSPTAAHLLMEHDLIDDYLLFINPVILGKGISLFTDTMRGTDLKLMTTKTFSIGVTALNYTVVRRIAD